MGKKKREKFYKEVIERIKEEYPKGYIIFDPVTMKRLIRIYKRYGAPVNGHFVRDNTRRILAAAMRSDSSIGYKAGRYSHNFPETLR